MTREGVQGAAGNLNVDSMSDSTSGSGSEGEERCEKPRGAQSKGDNGEDPLALFSACVSALTSNDGAAGESQQASRQAAGDAQRKRKDRRVHRTAEERKQRILDQLHPPSAKLTASAALDAEMTETVKTIAERSGMDAVAIAAMLSLDVDAVRAVLAAP